MTAVANLLRWFIKFVFFGTNMLSDKDAAADGHIILGMCDYHTIAWDLFFVFLLTLTLTL